MTGQVALRAPLEDNLLGFVQLLEQLQIAHRVSEEGNEQVVWVADERAAEQVRLLYQHHPHGLVNASVAAPPEAPLATAPGFWLQVRSSWLTSVILLLTLLLTFATQFGSNYQLMHWFTFQNFQVLGDYIYFQPWSVGFDQGQWWRLFTPALLHLGVLHLAMNALWFWELGRRVEYRQGRLGLFFLTLALAGISNAAQYAYSHVGIFGGLSGVLYGLLGYCWIFQRLAPTPAYALPNAVMLFMLAWLVICMTGVTEWLGLGAIANAAHLSGLLAGLSIGLFSGALARARR